MQLSKEEWKKYAESAHIICFNERRESSFDRIDFALLGIGHDNRPSGYITCRETDSETLYWQFGGAFPSVKGTALSYRAYEEFLNWTKSRYKRVYTLIENTNNTMLRMAGKIGFLITGIKVFDSKILLEHLMEFKNG